jgi:hypothetical protein
VKIDTLSRRLRFAPPQPPAKGKAQRVSPKPRDIRIFELLNEFGPLPSNFLYDLTHDLGRNKTKFQERVRDLYHGYWEGENNEVHISYLSKPDFQNRPGAQFGIPVIYDLNPLSIAVVEELRDPARSRIIRHTDPDIHRFMGACCLASNKLYLESQRYTYRNLAQLLEHEKCPEATRRLPNPLCLEVNGQKLVLDHIFAKEREELALHPWETDRKTESITSDIANSSIGKKIKLYDAAIQNDLFYHHLGFPRKKVYPTFITTNPQHMRNMAAEAAKYPTAPFFRFSWTPGFGKAWQVPKQLIWLEWIGADGRPVAL